MSADNPLFRSALTAIYQAALEPSAWPAALQKIADCTGDVGAILIYGRDDGGFGVVESPSLTPVVAAYEAGQWSFRDTRAVRCRTRGYFLSRDVITDRDVMLPSELASDPFYAEFLAGYGLKYFAAIMVSPNPKVEVAVSVQRVPDRPEFSDDEIGMLGALGPHIEQSLRLSSKLINSELVNEGLGAALSQMRIGVFVVDTLGRIVFSNTAAHRLVGDGVEIVNERLSLQPNLASKEYRDLIERVVDQDLAAGLPNPRPVLIHRARTDQPLALYAFPVIAMGHEKELFLAEGRAILLLIDSEPGEPDPALLRDVLGLTLGEAKVAAQVGAGASPRVTAERLGISEDTVRSVLKRIFVKVGVSRQGELVAMMTKLLLR
jgi:DNA-binding CsgD family transcriptional regulator